MPDIAIDDATPTCRVVARGPEINGKQGQPVYARYLRAGPQEARRIHLQIVRFPPDGRAPCAQQARRSRKLPSIS